MLICACAGMVVRNKKRKRRDLRIQSPRDLIVETLPRVAAKQCENRCGSDSEDRGESGLRMQVWRDYSDRRSGSAKRVVWQFVGWRLGQRHLHRRRFDNAA